MIHQRHSAIKLPERGCQGKLLATRQCWLLCIVRIGKWRSCECFRSWKHLTTKLSNGRVQGEAAGHWVLVITMYCRRICEYFGHLVLEKAVCAAGTCWMGITESGSKSIFLLAMSFQCPPLAKLQCQLAKENYLNGPDLFSQNRHKEWIQSQETKINKWHSPPLWLLRLRVHPSAHNVEFLYNKITVQDISNKI